MALALVAAGLLVHAIGVADVESRVLADTEQEITEFKTFQARDAARRQPQYRNVDQLLVGFLQNNVGGASEVLVGYYDGEIRRRSVSRRGEVITDEALRAAIAERVEQGGVTEVSTEFGEVFVDVQPIQTQAASDAAFAVAYFVDDEYADLDRLLRSYALAALLALLVVTGVAAWQAGRLLRPLRTLRTTAEEISEGDLSRRIEESGNDDVTALTGTFNAMLDRLESAFAAQRSFLDDASHELRTPLTVVRGHVELADPTDPDDWESTRELLLDEVDRMSRMVEDLLLLSKSDRPDFVDRSAAHPGEVLTKTFEKARALAPREWRLQIQHDVATEFVLIDEQRITQAVLALADNAVKHTAEGDVIALRLYRDGDNCCFEVSDQGPGVPEAMRAAIFERFTRAERPAYEGSGLGLSIVAAIAQAHDGSVALADPASARTRDLEVTGASFVITVPLLRGAYGQDLDR